MLYSKSAHTAGASGFFFDGDAKAPIDAIHVADADVQNAINLPAGSTYDFDSTGKLTTTAPTAEYLLAQAQLAQSAAFRQSAQVALDKSDTTMHRCVEAGIFPPAEWGAYRKALRAIVNGSDTTSTTLPLQPAYPAGT